MWTEPSTSASVVVAEKYWKNGMPKPESWVAGRTRLASVVMEEMEVVAARSVMNRASKRPSKVVVYTPPVTVPALPETEPWMVFANVLVPEK